MSEDTTKVGPRIRDLRKMNDMTLQELAEFTGLSVGHLSQIERSMASPTLDSLGKIAESLGTTISQLVSGPEEERRCIRFGDEDRIEFPDKNMRIGYYRFPQTSVIMERVEIDPGEVGEEPWSRHVCPEMAVVVSGEMTVIFEDERKVLHPGDAVIIPQNLRHKMLNEGSEVSQSIWVYLRRM